MVNADFSWFALFLAGLSTVTAYTAPVGEPKGNPIYTPSLGQRVPVGKPFTITWDPTTAGTVTILLERGPSNNVVPLYPIAEGIKNTGTFVWTPSAELEDDVSHYGLQLIVDGTGQYQWSTQFGISNPGYQKPAPVKPVPTSTRSVYPVQPVHPHSKPCTTTTPPPTTTPCPTTTKETHTSTPCPTTTTTPPPAYETSTVYVPPPAATSSSYPEPPAVSNPPYSPGSGAGAVSVQAAGAIFGVIFAAIFAM